MTALTRTTRKRALSLAKDSVSVSHSIVTTTTSLKAKALSTTAKAPKTMPTTPSYVRQTPWVSIKIPRTELDLSTTLKCGQSFRWHREHQELPSGEISSPTWSCVLDQRLWCLREIQDGIQFRTFRPSTEPVVEREQRDEKEEEEKDKEFLWDYFQLDVPLTELYNRWSNDDANFKAKAPLFPGVRILRQDPIENLICFICSSNNNISRISQMATKLCQNYGSPITIPPEDPDASPKTFYGFPAMETLAGDGVEEALRSLGFGYRAKYIANTAKMIKEMYNGDEWLMGLRKLPYEEAHSALLTLQGVGPKVADCVCLMSLDKHNAIPVDTHVWQIAVRDYQFRFEGKVPKTISPVIYKAVGKHFIDLFGEYSGWAHSVLFAADLRTIEGRIKKEDPDMDTVKVKEEKTEEATIFSDVKIEMKEESEEILVGLKVSGDEDRESTLVSQGVTNIKLEEEEPVPSPTVATRRQPMQPLKIAVAQFCGGQSVAANLATCIRLMGQASKQAAKMIFFPEASDFIGNATEEALTLSHPLASGQFLTGLCAEAKQLGIWCSVGIHEKSPVAGRLYNTHVLIDDQGSIVESYRKIHLFDVDILSGPQLMESNHTIAGDRLVPPVSTPVGKVGLGICYDLRFPELAFGLRKAGAEILTYPSAFTVKTGEAHWEVLLRSRAIETQSYVIAAAQVGQHSFKRTSYGHAMIIDPWGRIVGECDGENEGIAVASVDLTVLERIRTEMPVMNHRRYDVFPGQCNST
ncbi:8-oxoguanine glycosylase ogg1 [Mortierella sp. GBA30]|nr:8-oxoguanine glycosylase ogg1 [Mortierella sp. GBA30]